MAEASSSVVGLSGSSLNLSRTQRASAIASAKQGSSGQASLTISSFVRPFFSFSNALGPSGGPSDRQHASFYVYIFSFFFPVSLTPSRSTATILSSSSLSVSDTRLLLKSIILSSKSPSRNGERFGSCAITAAFAEQQRAEQ